MKGKLRVEFIKSLGFMFAIGDEYEYPIGTVKVEQRYLLCLNSDVNKDWSARFITHFADRINTDNKGHCGLDNIKPSETEQERIDKLKTDQRKEVFSIVYGELGHLLSPVYYTYIDDAVKELQGSGLLCAVGDSNKS